MCLEKKQPDKTDLEPIRCDLSRLVPHHPYASLRMLLHFAKGKGTTTEEDVGLLVQVGFDIAAFRPPAYQRGSLPRPSQMSHLEDGFALRCFQRLS